MCVRMRVRVDRSYAGAASAEAVVSGGVPRCGRSSAKSGKTLKFTRTGDSAICSGRTGVLAHAFTQQG
jgi:hypothetical protein